MGAFKDAKFDMLENGYFTANLQGRMPQPGDLSYNLKTGAPGMVARVYEGPYECICIDVEDKTYLKDVDWASFLFKGPSK